MPRADPIAAALAINPCPVAIRPRTTPWFSSQKPGPLAESGKLIAFCRKQHNLAVTRHASKRAFTYTAAGEALGAGPISNHGRQDARRLPGGNRAGHARAASRRRLQPAPGPTGGHRSGGRRRRQYRGGPCRKSAARRPTLLLTGNAALVVNQSLYEKLPFDPAKDFVPISQVAITPNVLVVHPDVPAKSVQELVAFAKRSPMNWPTRTWAWARHSTWLPSCSSRLRGISIRPVAYRGGNTIYPDSWPAASACASATSPQRCLSCGKARCVPLP